MNNKKAPVSYQILGSLSCALMFSICYIAFIQNYCVSIFESNTGYSDPKLNNYYSQVARFPIWIPTLIFMILNIIIFKFTMKKYKAFSISYLILTVFVSIISLFFIKTEIARGI
ncbi:MAG: hypothetical protein Q8942_09620 [Bacillota bacterium]|nr:hypothetical protein [Bacillota bacterium]